MNIDSAHIINRTMKFLKKIPRPRIIVSIINSAHIIYRTRKFFIINPRPSIIQ